MRSAVAKTSLDAFHGLSVADYLQPREREVVRLLSGQADPLTREQIALQLGWKESAVCGRVNSLVTKRVLEEVEGGKTMSGRAAKLVRLMRSAQQALF